MCAGKPGTISKWLEKRCRSMVKVEKREDYGCKDESFLSCLSIDVFSGFYIS